MVSAQLCENYQSVSIKGETIFAFETFLYKNYSCHTLNQAIEGLCYIQK